MKSVMAAILLTSGPISSSTIIARSGPVFLRNLHKWRFLEAAKALEEMKLGTLVNVFNKQVVFLKKSPEDVRSLLEASDLECRFKDYVSRFHRPIMAAINEKMRSALVQLGYIKLR